MKLQRPEDREQFETSVEDQAKDAIIDAELRSSCCDSPFFDDEMTCRCCREPATSITRIVTGQDSMTGDFIYCDVEFDPYNRELIDISPGYI